MVVGSMESATEARDPAAAVPDGGSGGVRLKLEELNWDHSFVRELPGDPRTDTISRQVKSPSPSTDLLVHSFSVMFIPHSNPRFEEVLYWMLTGFDVFSGITRENSFLGG